MAPPRTLLYRLGRWPDPLALPPPQFTGAGRFDDPARRFRVLYVAKQRRACFAEILAAFRPDLEVIAARRDETGKLELDEQPAIPAGWLQGRAIQQLRLGSRQRWLDLRALEIREQLREVFASLLVELGIPDLDLSAVTRSDLVGRKLTQQIAAWAYDNGYHGITYPSRLAGQGNCRALFEGSRWTAAGNPELVAPDDPDLLAVARVFDLTVPGASR